MLAEYKLNGVFWFRSVFQWLDPALKLKFLGHTLVREQGLGYNCAFPIYYKMIFIEERAGIHLRDCHRLPLQTLIARMSSVAWYRPAREIFC